MDPSDPIGHGGLGEVLLEMIRRSNFSSDEQFASFVKVPYQHFSLL